MRDYARMNTHYLLPLYDKLLYELAQPSHDMSHIIPQVHTESNTLALKLYKPITVKDRVTRWMKKSLLELRGSHPDTEPSEMQVCDSL
mgnify:FL=1